MKFEMSKIKLFDPYVDKSEKQIIQKVLQSHFGHQEQEQGMYKNLKNHLLHMLMLKMGLL